MIMICVNTSSIAFIRDVSYVHRLYLEITLYIPASLVIQVCHYHTWLIYKTLRQVCSLSFIMAARWFVVLVTVGEAVILGLAPGFTDTYDGPPCENKRTQITNLTWIGQGYLLRRQDTCFHLISLKILKNLPLRPSTAVSLLLPQAFD